MEIAQLLKWRESSVIRVIRSETKSINLVRRQSYIDCLCLQSECERVCELDVSPMVVIAPSKR